MRRVATQRHCPKRDLAAELEVHSLFSDCGNAVSEDAEVGTEGLLGLGLG